MPAKILKIRDTHPNQIENISLDTSFLIRFFTKFDPTINPYSHYNPKDYADCIEYLINAGVLCCVSDFVIEEIYFSIFKACGLAQYNSLPVMKRKYRTWKDFFENEPTHMKSAYPILDKFNSFLDTNTIFVMDYCGSPTDSPWIYNKANNIIQSANLISNDAFIIAHGLHCGLSNFLTTDSKWIQVDGITIYQW